MIIRRIKLRGVRSHTDTEIELPEGVTLLMGSIGSGKSSILLAIEYGLFGTSSDVGLPALLRHGCDQAVIEVTFEADGEEYTVHREILRKRGRVQAGPCWLRGPGGRETLSQSEMKRRILDILRFNETPRAKVSSLVYRYAVYTPQEEMKKVLTERAEDRLQTIRKAVRIEEYKTARDNLREVVRSLREDLAAWRARAEGLEEHRAAAEREEAHLNSLREEEKKLLRELAALTRELEGLEDSIKRLEETEERYSSAREALQAVLTEIRRSAREIESMRGDVEKAEALGYSHEHLERLKGEEKRLSERLRESVALKREAAHLREEIERMRAKEASLAEWTSHLTGLKSLRDRQGELTASVEDLKSQAEALQREYAELDAQERHLRSETRRLKEQLDEEESSLREFLGLRGRAVCPMCGQDLSPEHFEEVLAKRKERVAEIKAEIGEVSSKLDGVRRRISDLGREKAQLDRKLKRVEGEREAVLRELSRLEALQERASTVRKELKSLPELEARLEECTARISEMESLEKRELELRTEIERLERMRREYLRLLRGYASTGEAREHIGQMEAELTELRSKRAKLEEELRSMAEAIEEMKPLRQRMSQYRERHGAVRESLSRTRREIDRQRTVLDEARKRLEDAENAVRHCTSLESTAEWMGLLSTALEQIELEVLQRARADFQDKFQEIFSQLIPDIDVSIDETFTPVVVQDGYEVPPAHLSGGEKTSLALAYRLALNSLVYDYSGISREERMLILDEPTDGFSREQFTKLRELFESIDCPQILIVSHDPEMEGFADTVYYLEKVDGKTAVRRGA